VSEKKIKFEEQPSRPFIVKQTKRGGFKAFDVMVLEENKAEKKVFIKIKGGECRWIDDNKLRYNKREGSSWRRCCTCNEVFELTIDEKRQFLDNGLRTPSHCQACRDKKKETGQYKDKIDNIDTMPMPHNIIL
jgi:hypothetical protein